MEGYKKIIFKTKSSEHSAPLLLTPAEGSGALLWIFGPLFITMKLYFESEFPFFWGRVCFIILFDLMPPYIGFWFFGTLGGLFWVWFLVFENFEIVFWITIPTFGGGLFYKTFWFEASLYMFLIFWNFRGSFFEFDFWFLKISNLYFE